MTTSHVISRKVKDYWSLLEGIYKKCFVRGLVIETIKSDLELATLQELVNEVPSILTMLLAAQGEHIGLVEQNIRCTVAMSHSSIRKSAKIYTYLHGLCSYKGYKHVPTQRW